MTLNYTKKKKMLLAIRVGETSESQFHDEKICQVDQTVAMRAPIMLRVRVHRSP